MRLWRHAGYGRGIRPLEALAFGTGWLALAIALSPPLDEWSDAWLAAHMVQHELLMVVAAPLIAVGAPLDRRCCGRCRARAGARASTVRQTQPASPCVDALTAPASRVPALWRSRCGSGTCRRSTTTPLEHEAVHVVQHLCFFGTAALFWWGIAHGRQGRRGYGAAVVYVFATAVHGGVLGALLTVSPRVWYAPYLAHHPAGLTPLEDQQLAGLLMWVPAGLAFAAGGLFLFAAWLRQSDRRSRFQSRPLVRPTRYPMSITQFRHRRRARAVAMSGRGMRRPVRPPVARLGAARQRSRRAADDPSGRRCVRRRVADAGRRLRQPSLQHARHHQDDERDEPARRHDLLDRHSAWPRRPAAGLRQHDVRGDAVSQQPRSPSI